MYIPGIHSSSALLLLTAAIWSSTPTHAGHLHRHLRYRQLGEDAQQVVDPASELSADMTKVQQSVSSLGSGLLDYLSLLSNRVSQVEKTLDIGNSSVSQPGSNAIGPAATASSLSISMSSTPTLVASSGATTMETITTSSCPSSISLIGDASMSEVTKQPSYTATTFATSATSASAQAPSSQSIAAPVASIPPTSLSNASVTEAQSTGNTSYTFNPASSSNVAVYYGASPQTQANGLLPLCEDPNIDMVILAFVPTFFTSGSSYPSVNFGPACHADADRSSTAPGLLDCSALGTQVAQCQATYGKKILVSLGGYVAQSSFDSDTQAASFAQTLWTLFGPDEGNNATATALRPLGAGVVVDGFDVDNEDHSTAHWSAFATALRSLYAADSSRQYYLSAAPQCPRPDASIPSALYQHADFVWVQFYNNPGCNADAGAGFVSSVAQWSADLAAAGSSGPRLYVGLGAWSGAGSGFVQASGLPALVQAARGAATANFGGIMLWDGTNGEADGYVAQAKAALAAS